MIFLDNASTTKISKEALDVYINESQNNFYNPSALYLPGASISQRITQEKQKILKILNANKFDNIVFTSGATESNNMVINSFVTPRKKALFGITEHPSVYNVAKKLLDQGYNIEFINVNTNGVIDIEDFRNKLTDDVNFVSIMHINNETGAINPIKELVHIVKTKNKSIIFHVDGVQAFGKVDVDIDDLGVDLYTISSHKIMGPKGIGLLYIKKGINIKPLIIGGGQEHDLRSGTENTPAIFAFGKACELIEEYRQKYECNIRNLCEYTKLELKKVNSDLLIFSDNNCSPFVISFALRNLRAETILRMLEQRGVLIGNGSACSSHKSGNRILSNMNVGNEYIEGALRLSFNYFTTKEEIDEFINKLKEIVIEYKNKTSR